MKNKVLAITLIFFSVMIFSDFTFAEDIKSRMIERLPVINALKNKGIIGENSSGYLEFVQGNKENQDVVNAENNDRRAVYSDIAKQNGTTIEVVGQQRAAQIGKKAIRGEWLRDSTGKWIKKE